MKDIQVYQYPEQLFYKVSGAIVQVLFFIIAARILLPEEFGVLAIITTILLLSQIIAELGFGSVLIQLDTLHPEDLNTAFWLSVGVASTLALALYLTSDWLGYALHMAQLPDALRYSIIALPMGAIQTVPRSALVRRLQFRGVALIEFGSIVGACIFGILLLAYGIRLPALIAFIIIQSILRTILFFSLSRKMPGIRMTYESINRIVVQGKNILTHSLLNFLSKYADNIIVGKFLGAYALGIYSTSYRVLQIHQDHILGTMRQLVLPVYARLQHEKNKLYQEICRDIQLIVGISMPMVFLGILWAKQIVVLVLGERWMDTTLLVQIFLLEAGRQSITSLLPTALIAIGESRAMAKYSLISTPVLIAIYWLTANFGILWVALGFFLVNSLFAVYLIYLFRQSFQNSMQPLVSQWIPGIIISLGIVFAHFILKLSGCIESTYSVLQVFAFLSELMILVISVRHLFPALARNTRIMLSRNNVSQRSISFMNRKASREDGKVEDKYQNVYLDPLRNEENPHLTLLHTEVQAKTSRYELKGFSFRHHIKQRIIAMSHMNFGNPGIIHFHFINKYYVRNSLIRSMVSGCKFISLVAFCRLIGARIVWTMHNVRAHDFKNRTFEKYMLMVFVHLCDAIVVQCLTGKKYLWEVYGRNQDVFYTPHPFYTDIYQDSLSEAQCRKYLKIHKNEVMYTFLGRIMPYKGIDTLINEFKKWHPEKRVRLHIAGPCADNNYEKYLRQLTEGDDRISIEANYLKNDLVQNILKASHYGILPYREILHSSTSILYFTFEKPVIVPDIGWFPEIFEKDNVGIMYSHTEKGALASALDASLRINPESFKKGIQSLNTRWTLDEAADVILQTYDHVLCRKGKRHVED